MLRLIGLLLRMAQPRPGYLNENLFGIETGLLKVNGFCIFFCNKFACTICIFCERFAAWNGFVDRGCLPSYFKAV